MRRNDKCIVKTKLHFLYLQYPPHPLKFILTYPKNVGRPLTSAVERLQRSNWGLKTFLKTLVFTFPATDSREKNINLPLTRQFAHLEVTSKL